MNEKCFLRVELVESKYVVVDQDGRRVQGVTALSLEADPSGDLAEVKMSFIPFCKSGKAIK